MLVSVDIDPLERVSEFEALRSRLVACLLAGDRITLKDILTRCYFHQRRIKFVEELVIPALEQIGIGLENGRYSVSQTHRMRQVTEELLDLIMPLTANLLISQPKLAIAVLEDQPILEKRIVASFLRASGYELTDYGRMSVDELVQQVIADDVNILLISVLMASSALQIKDLRARLDQAGFPVKLVVSGAPFRFDALLWQQVGADAYAENSLDAIDTVHNMIEEMVRSSNSL
jgi:methanogenic corrinoid protein MtbC1